MTYIIQPGKLIVDMTTPRWVQSFMNRFRIVSRAQTDMVCLEKQAQIERDVAFHPGTLSRQFASGVLDENDIGNADEMHFDINLDNHRTLGRCGENEVKYADVVSGSEGMTIMVRISGGREAVIENAFLVFRNKYRSYAIQGVADDKYGVSYRSDPKGCMDRTVFSRYIGERKVIRALPNGRKRI